MSGSARMCLQIEQLDPRTERAWDEEARSHPAATPFHCSAWARVLSDAYGQHPRYLRVTAGGKLAALVPMMEVQSFATGKRGVCLPFSDLCEPLLFLEEARAELIEQLYRLGRTEGWKYYELRGDSLCGAESSAGESYYAHQLSLDVDLERLFAGFDSSNQRAIRKAARSGLAVEISTNRKSVDEYVGLHARTRRRHGLPPQPARFFHLIQRYLLERGLGFMVLVRQDEKAVAGAMFLQQGPFAIYKFGASSEAALDLRPNNLAIWHGIQELVRRNAKILHFGRTDVLQDGLRRFKMSWGAQERLLRYFKLDLRTNLPLAGSSSQSQFHRLHSLFRVMPLAINRLAGAMIYPHLD